MRPTSPNTGKKRNMKIPDDIWEAAIAKTAVLAALGYKGENGPISTTDLVRYALRLVGQETVEQTVLRLGLSRELRRGEPDPDRHMTSAEAAAEGS